MSYARTPVPERFWPKVDKRGADECWEWTASRRGRGYGSFGVPDVGVVDAHRMSYALAHDMDVTNMPFVVRHTCDNPPCVNPAHLLAGTMQDNMDDMWERDRGRFPFATLCQRGHDLAALGVYVNRKDGKRRCAQCHRDRQNAWESKRRAS